MAKDRRLHSGRWTNLSKQVLKEENYECYIDDCQTVATTVDHLKPSSKYPDLFYVRENLRACCAYHNFSKQDKEAGAERITWFNSEWFTKETIKEMKEQI